ncbi:MAG: phytanoyl-CoA dioxygenase family protein [Alphaproteobacteria bacterium]|nr:phytanoyl-CoA dioxygenase family protein [Alphaproteobacteria bacterium]
MPLSASEVARFQRDGYLFPFDVVTRADVASARAGIEAWERTLGGPVPKERRQKPHLFMTFLDAIVHAPEVLDRVESIIGPDILCWESVLFIKEPGTADFISWHQDATYWGLEPYEILTAWIALSPATRESGCMRMLPGSHVGDLAPHVDTFAPNNMLSRGQEIAVAVDESKAVDVVLQPGQMSLHHVKIAHGSAPNRSQDRRIGLAIRYVPAHVRQAIGDGDTAMLVRGRDRHKHFELEPRPSRDFAPEDMERQRLHRERRMQILMRRTDKTAA